jgi:hypothetical protein
LPDTPVESTEYAYAYTPEARRLRDQLPAELLPKPRNVIDDLASNPDGYPLRVQSIGKDESGELIKYIHPELPVEITCQIDRTNHKITSISPIASWC